MENDTEMIDDFVTEAKEHLDTIEEDLLNLEKQKDNPDRKLVDKVFRAIHSIKGASGFLGLRKIGDLAHVMETLLSMMRAGELRPESEFIDALLSGADILATMVDDVRHSNEVDITTVHERLSGMLDLSPKVKSELNTAVKLSCSEGNEISFDINEFTLKNIPSNMSLYVLRYDLTELARHENKGPLVLIRELLSTGDIIDAKIDVPSYDLREGLPKEHLLYEVLYATILFPDDIQEVTGLKSDQILHVRRDGLRKTVPSPQLQEPDSEPEIPDAEPEIPDAESEIPDSSSPCQEPRISAQNYRASELSPEIETENREPARGKPVSPSKSCVNLSRTLRIDVDVLDKLMMLAGELVLVRNQQLLFAETSAALSRSAVQRLDIVTTELQETIMRTRMQPIGKLFGKLPRLVRDFGKKHGKQIKLSISGSDVELDKTILEFLADPLTHLIRNCCDHAIESPEKRIRAKKPEAGCISLSAYHEAGHINIDIRDDGRGIDPDLIRKKAMENQIKTKDELERMSNKDILRLVLLPGFSTTDKVTDLSGRGVGMDVVKTGIDKLGGTLDLESTTGKGTEIHLRLPLTLAIIPCLVVVEGENRYAIPQINLVELVCLYDKDVTTKIECTENQEIYRLRDRLLPMIRFSEVLARPTMFTHKAKAEITEKYRNQLTDNVPESLSFAVLKVGNLCFGLIIDRVLGTEEIVVKPMHPAVKSLSIYSGATIMGDGKVALILDVEGIAAYAGIITDNSAEEARTNKMKSDENLQTVLLFKYGEKEQFAMSLPLIRRIERISISDIEYIGEKEFVTINGISTWILRPDKVLTVSPGAERDDMFLIIPKYIRQPMGLLASELVDIQEASVELNVESYMEDGLLGTSVVRDHMTLFIDIYRLIEKAEPEWFDERRTENPPPDAIKQVLLVEDASFFRQLIKGYLKADGYKVITAENGQAGLDRMNETQFDLIVSDIEMPVMDGWDFMENVRKNEQKNHIPAVALTALDAEKDREKAIKCGYDRYEIKLDRERFLTTVAEMLKK
ncbi:hybrid sensor histidine kinase/response regulator [Desulfonema magnum]|uniref:histidine kinase n=1 Tax=Desulfonema magnum TaxID=45655 RepID=A0A975BRP9_9BACT|nr:hybrid sensor histidine kinase/response regulator [Desulfonema magnum]QTA90487.1 Two component system response regulator/histidine kinase, CheW domain-containing [Desulfonema magnum]